MCYEKSKWENARDAILKSSMSIPRYCINPMERHRVLELLDNFEIGDMPLSFENPGKKGEIVKIKKD